jgi:hypothetical protein
LDAAAAAPDETVAAHNIVGVLAWCVGLVGSMELLCALVCTQLVEAGGAASRILAGALNLLIAVVAAGFLVRMPVRLRRTLPLLARRHQSLAGASGAILLGFLLTAGYAASGLVWLLQVGVVAVCASMIWFRVAMIILRRKP